MASRPTTAPCRQRLAVALGAAVLALALVYTDALWRWDNLLYDAHLGLWRRHPGDDIVIIAIDDKSLMELGRWPWPRRIHAQLLDRLTAAGARGVALDVVFAEPDPADPAGDAELARAVAGNGRVVLPVLAEHLRLGAPLVETLPLPELTTAAAGLGHVDVELDQDGVARRVFLKAGLAEPHWPTFALALLNLGQPPPDLPGLRNGHGREGYSPYQWVRDHQALIPFAGPPGQFGRLSYVDVLRGEVPARLLRDRWVLVGTTAAGLGDLLPTPVAELLERMSGVEFNANVLDMLRRDLAIRPLDLPWRLGLSAALVLLPALLCRLAGGRWNLLTEAAPVVLILAGSLLLLRLGQVWFPPAAPLLALGLSYPLWFLGRLRQLQSQARTDGLTRLANRRRFDDVLALELRSAIRSGKPLSLLLIDVDFFKLYNDTYGHQAGDDCLRRVARALGDQARRPRDLAARYGGEEFALILGETPATGAALIAGKVRAGVESLAIPHATSRAADRVTVSIGAYTCVPRPGTPPKELIDRADAALYQAKQEGRNRVHNVAA